MKTVTMKTKAWITNYSLANPADILLGKKIDDLAFNNQDMSAFGWTFVGDAELTVHLVDRKTLVDNKVEALRAEAKNIRAEATAKCTKIEGQIQNLLAISYDEGTA